MQNIILQKRRVAFGNMVVASSCWTYRKIYERPGGLVAVSSPSRLRFSPRVDHVELEVDETSMGRVFLAVLRITPENYNSTNYP
jgi:hypothetical protein